MCTVQKFVKSQLHSKQYTLKLTEIYPVAPTITECDFQDSDSSDSDYPSEEEDNNASVSAPVHDPSNAPVDDDDTSPSHLCDTNSDFNVQPSRCHSQPAWMSSGEYDVSTEDLQEDDDQEE